MSKLKKSLDVAPAKGSRKIRKKTSNVVKPSLVGKGSAVAKNVFQLLNIDAASKAISSFDYIKLGQNGITKLSIDQLAQHIGMSRKNIAEQIFDISVKTLERKTPDEKLDKKISSHAVELAKLLQHANEIFDDEEKVRQWVNTKNAALNNNAPVSFFDTFTGLGMVNDILIRIEEGVYS
jgi:putative toxin-antitoxin system antitoxin component (TIGR02293 family)